MGISCLIVFLLVGGICWSHDEMKRAVGLFCDFSFTIDSPPCAFLYLNKEYMNLKEKEGQKRERKALYFVHLSHPLHLL